MSELRNMTDAEVEDLMEMVHGGVSVDEEGRYRIKSDQEAEWALTQIRNAEEEKKMWKLFYEDRYKAVCNTCDLTIANMQSLLQSYFAKVPHKVTKTEESYVLPSGKIYMKDQEPEFDTKGLLDWLKVNGKTEFIEYKESAKWSDFKKTLAKDPEGKFAVVETENGLRAVTKDGEITPIPVTLRQPEFKVKV